MGTWLELLKQIGQALLDLVSAEAKEVGADLRGTGRSLAHGLLLLAIAGALAVLSLVVLSLALVWALTLVFAPWQAALLVGGVYAAAAVIVGLVARGRLRRLEAPAVTVKRHWEEQRQWFQERVSGASTEEEADV